MAISRQNLGLVTVAVIVAVVCGTVAWNFAHAAAMSRYSRPFDSSRMLGKQAPNFRVVTNRGVFDLAAAKTPVLLEVFATWCGHCKSEVKTVNQMYGQFHDRVAFIAVTGSPYGIDGTSPESAADVNRFARALHMESPVAYDPTLAVAHAFLVGAYPTIVVIDRSRKVTFQAAGEVPGPVLAQALSSVH